MIVREYQQGDEGEWLRMRRALWPDIAAEDEVADGHAWLSRKDATVLVADAANGLQGFVEVGERGYADGCDTSPVAYLEGWYVDPQHRMQGVGRLLIRAAVSWARQRGLTEFASDALLENAVSHAAHEAAGFEEVERAVRFRMKL